MKPMSEAPRDGTRILLKYWPKLYYSLPRHLKWDRKLDYGAWQRTPEPKWEEMRYTPQDDPWTGNNPRWEEWTGDPKVRSSGGVQEEDCIGWLPVPEDEE